MNDLSKQTSEIQKTKNPETQNTEATLRTAKTAFSPARKGTRQAQLVALLQRKSGATIGQISERLGWQAHTSRAALTGLRKRGYSIERITKDGKASTYLIRDMAEA